MDRRFTPLLSLALTALFLGGCSDANQPTATPKEPITSTEVQAPENPWIRDCTATIKSINDDIRNLEKTTAPFTPERVLVPLNAIEKRIADGASFASLMENVHPDSDVRSKASECTTAYSDLATALSLSRAIYEAVSQTDVRGQPDDTQRYHF
jgi:hypothetical protein